MNWKDNTIFSIARILFMWIVTAFRGLFGEYDNLLITLIVFISADYITGICAAILAKELSSHVGATGLLKKFGILCIISITAVIEKNILETTALRSAVILYYISNEGISILENLCRVGVPVPQKLRSILTRLQDDDIDNGNN